MNTTMTATNNINKKTGRIIAKGGFGKVITHVDPITLEQSAEFNDFLRVHNLVKGPSLKRMRIYRKLAESNRKIIRSRDFIYVVSADRFRTDLDTVKKDLIKLSKQVMDKALIVKNEEYRAKMTAVEEELLYKGIEMNWYNGKSVKFCKIPHVITDREVLKNLDEYFAAKAEDSDTTNGGLRKFRRGAKISEMDKKWHLDWDKWAEHNVIFKDGKVIAAYSYKHLTPLTEIHFDEGIQDKFGYNLNIIKPKNIKSILKMSADLDKKWEAEV